MDAWGYIGIGVLLAVVGALVLVGGSGYGLVAIGIGSVPLLIGVIAEGVRIGNRDSR